MNPLNALIADLDNRHDRRNIFDGQSFSYHDLIQYSKRLTTWLLGEKCHCAMFTLKNSPLNIALYLAGWQAGIDLIPVNPRLIGHELIEIINRHPPSVLFIEKVQQNASLIQICQAKTIKVVVIDDPLKFLQALPKMPAPTATENHQKQSITYHISSGTGGYYQFYGHTLKQILDYAEKRQFDVGLISGDRPLITLSVNHAYAFSYQLLPALKLGLDLVILPEFDLKKLTSAIQSHNITTLALLPAMYYFLLDHIEKHFKTYSHQLRFLSIAGDQPNPKLMRKAINVLKVPLRNGIGMTEIYGYAQNITSAPAYHAVQLFEDTSVKIAPFKHGRKENKEKNPIGEIMIQSPMQPVNLKDAWLKSGDFGYLDSNHNLYFLGRIKDIIIKGGSNISPLELEHYLHEMAEITEVAIIGKKDLIWGEKICACIVTCRALSLNQINRHLKTFVAPYKHIDEIFHFDTLPKNISGKIDRRLLKERIDA